MHTDSFMQLLSFARQIGFGTLELFLIVNQGEISKMKVRGTQTHLYNRSKGDTNDNTQAIKHISTKINDALKNGNVREINFTMNFDDKCQIKKVGWESEFFTNQMLPGSRLIVFMTRFFTSAFRGGNIDILTPSI